MKKIVHRAENRGQGDYGWLTTRYSFSFADWYDPTRMGFGTLRVINDDSIAPASGFGAHSHRDMEIITVVMEGTVTHKDSLGNTGIVPAGDVQVMSAGSGVTHSEYNDSETDQLTLFQIWIESRERGIAPYYNQRSFDFLEHKEGSLCLVDPDGKNGLLVHQDTYIHHLTLPQDSTHVYSLYKHGHGVYVLVVEGECVIEGEHLKRRDAIGITESGDITITATEVCKLLLIEVPMH